jgi:hypothetical protein
MIEFFEFLNTCSSGRTFLYLLFIIIFLFIVLSGITSIIKGLIGDNNNHFYYYNDEKVEQEEIVETESE